MFKCPFLEEHPDLFLLLVGLLSLAYLLIYGLYCLILFLLFVQRRGGRCCRYGRVSVGFRAELFQPALPQNLKRFDFFFRHSVCVYMCVYVHICVCVCVCVCACEHVCVNGVWKYIYVGKSIFNELFVVFIIIHYL